MIFKQYDVGAPWNNVRPFLSGIAAAVTCLALCGSGTAAEHNWGQWRGPSGTGAAPDAEPPISWSETSNVKWKVQIPGKGSSTPIVWGQQVFIQTAIPTGKKVEVPAEAPVAEPAPPGDAPGGRGRRRGGRGMGAPKPTETYQFVLMCFDRATGKTLWQKIAREELPHEGHHEHHGFSSHSPVTDGEHVFAYFGSRGLHCFDMQGNLKWEQDLGQMKTKLSFGEGSSPALHGRVIVVNWDHEGDDFIVGLDKSSGKELWRQPRNEDTTWATPLVVEHEGKAQVITAATGKVRSYDLATGEPVWQAPGLTPNAIPTPVASEGMLYATSGFRGSALFAIRLGRTGDLTGTDAIVWSHTKSTPYVPSPLLYDNRLYFFAANNAILSCFEAKTGKPLFETERVEGLQNVYASPVGAKPGVYLIGRNGTTAVIGHSDKLEILSTNVLDEGIDASPAIVGNELFLRGQQHLYCIAEKSE